MKIMIYAMFAIVFLAVIFAFVMLIKRKNVSVDAEPYAVFKVVGNQLTILAGLPVTYDLGMVEQVTFSAVRGRRGSSYTGIMRVVKTNGKKSRPFIFDSSSYKKKTVWVNSKQDIEAAIIYLTDELSAYSIRATWKR